MLLSIFTPTYNRRNKLEQLYRSLKNQIDDECEWKRLFYNSVMKVFAIFDI